MLFSDFSIDIDMNQETLYNLGQRHGISQGFAEKQAVRLSCRRARNAVH